jgi:hypothetical protein
MEYESSSRTIKIMVMGCVVALVGALAASYLGPKAIAWYFDPPVDIGVNCRKAVEWSMARLQIVQMVGFLGGFILGVIGMFWMTRKPKSAA